jgi:hypothetical protein
MANDFKKLHGWRRDPGEVARALAGLKRPHFATAAPHLARSGAGKTVLLYKAFKDVNGGRYIDYPAQAIGDCVSQSFGHGIDLLEAVQIGTGKAPQRFQQTATEAIYGMARVDVGGLRGSYEDGAVGAWAATAVNKLGTLGREAVGPYDGDRAKDWGAHGVPAALAARAGAYKVHTTSLVTTFGELKDALANGYPVTVCSDQGFTEERDADGFCAPEGTWAHCMLIVGAAAAGAPAPASSSRGAATRPPGRSPSTSPPTRSGPTATSSRRCSPWATRGPSRTSTATPPGNCRPAGPTTASREAPSRAGGSRKGPARKTGTTDLVIWETHLDTPSMDSRSIWKKTYAKVRDFFAEVPGALKDHLNGSEVTRVVIAALSAGGGVFGVLQALATHAGVIFPAPPDAALATAVLTLILEAHRRLGQGAEPPAASRRSRRAA